MADEARPPPRKGEEIDEDGREMAITEHTNGSGTTSLDPTDADERRALERAIGDMPGVVAVRLVAGDGRPVDELHVVVAPDRDPKNTARDLQTVLLAQFGVDIDRRVISVARLGDTDVSTLRHGSPRLTLGAVVLTVRADEISVSVELEDDDGERVTGHAGPVDDRHVARAVAEATTRAVGEAVDLPLSTRSASIVTAEQDRLALVTVQVEQRHGAEVLSGSALVRGAVPDAAARAVLDATNRLTGR